MIQEPYSERTPESLTFDLVWALTQTVSAEAAYHREELELLFEAVNCLPRFSTVVEIGCEWGRSTSVLAQVAKARQHRLFCVDPFQGPEGQVHAEVAAGFMGVMLGIGRPFVLCVGTTAIWQHRLPARIDLVHIDGDHSEAGVREDCQTLLWRVRPGGFAVFHDYGRDSLPEVKPTVDAELTPHWVPYKHVMTCYAVRRKAEGE